MAGVQGARVRAVVLLAGLAAGWTAALWLAQPTLSWPAHRLEESLAWVLGALLLAGWAWWSAAVAVLAVEVAATGVGPRARSHGPRAARTLVAAVCGVGAVAVAGPALADQVEGHPAGVQVLAGLALPDRATGPASRSPLAPDVVVVHEGDSLWALATHLGVGWRSLYDANRRLIGSDPDLIHPGQRLVVPSHTHPEGASR